jgi:hypothetical protein
MSKVSQHSFSSVISINPYNNTYISSVSSFLTQNRSPAFLKEQFALSYLNTKDFINAQIEISKNIPEEDLHDAINNKAYDELALDQAIEYHIQYIETFNNLDEDNRHFHVFIVDPLETAQTFEKVVDAIKYIDIIIPAPLLIKSLYSKEIIDESGVHCFLYFQENDAFLTIYSEREFIYTKSIKYSLIDMHERFCELYGERIDYESFINFYTKHSLKETQSDYKEYFIKLYKELFANVNDILTYVKRAFDIENFEHVYVGSQLDTVTKLDEMLEVELNIKTTEFDFDYGYENDGVYIDQLHALMHIYTTVAEDERYECNFSTYNRPPAFLKRESGKIITLAFVSFILAFAYPVTYWSLNYAQKLQEDLLNQKYREIHNIKITRQATIKNKEADKTKYLKLIENQNKEFTNKKNTLMKIHEVKVNYPMKAKLITLLTKDLNRYKVKMESLTYTEDNNQQMFTLNLVSSKDRRITKLIEYMTSKYADKFKFTLQEIKYDDEYRVYKAQLKVIIL